MEVRVRFGARAMAPHRGALAPSRTRRSWLSTTTRATDFDMFSLAHRSVAGSRFGSTVTTRRRRSDLPVASTSSGGRTLARPASRHPYELSEDAINNRRTRLGTVRAAGARGAAPATHTRQDGTRVTPGSLSGTRPVPISSSYGTSGHPRLLCSRPQSIVNSCVCGFKWRSLIAPAVSGPLKRKTLSPSPMLVSYRKLSYQ